VIDPVDALLDERQAMDRGLPAGMLISLFAHLMLVGGAFAVVLFAPHEPPLKVVDGFVVPLPPGGLGRPNAEPAAPAPSAAPEPAPSEAPPAPKAEPPKVIKPPKPEPRKGLPEPDARRAKPRPEPTPPARSASTSGERPAGRSTETPGFEFGPPGPGVPGGTDMMGDWYLAGVQRKVWTIWIQQVKANFTQPITVQFTILADGSLDEDVRVVQSSGVPLLDMAAKRAIYNAQPFGPLPKHYGTSRYTIQGIFRPAP
jgi:periplasmic protein TonB